VIAVAGDAEELPAYALPAEEAAERRVHSDWPRAVDRDWAWGGSRGEGVRVCIVDSGIDGEHPLVRPVESAVTPVGDHLEPDERGDANGHGTACAGIIRSIAPDCQIASARVLGPDVAGTGRDLLSGLRWAIAQGYHVINLSLSTTRRAFLEQLHELADWAYFRGSVIVSAAHNLPVDSWPWRFASVVSVAGHTGQDPLEFHVNPSPPVEFLARGVNVDVPWPGGGMLRVSGNSFAAPHMVGICALILGKHPHMTPAQLKSVLYLTASNVQAQDGR
jgi:subtilisin family serine protease